MNTESRARVGEYEPSIRSGCLEVAGEANIHALVKGSTGKQAQAVGGPVKGADGLRGQLCLGQVLHGACHATGPLVFGLHYPACTGR